jgi:hypothetical protein
MASAKASDLQSIRMSFQLHNCAFVRFGVEEAEPSLWVTHRYLIPRCIPPSGASIFDVQETSISAWHSSKREAVEGNARKRGELSGFQQQDFALELKLQLYSRRPS